MNPLAEELNATIETASPAVEAMLSGLGRELFYPRGILTQTAEAREHAHLYNATIGIARSGGEAMHLPAVMDLLCGLSPDQAVDYAPTTGNPELRKRWLEDMYGKNPSLEGKSTSLPVVTSGITHGLTIAGELFLDPGDVVLLPDKYWGNYRLVYAVRRGAEIRTFPFFTPRGGFDTAELAYALAAVLDEKGKAFVVLNFPNNPTGYSVTRTEAPGIVEAITSVTGPGREVVVVHDDAYFGLFYEDEVLEESLFGLLAGKDEHVLAVKLDGATKEEYVWGLRCGFITFNARARDGEEAALYAALEKKVGGAIRGNISNCSQLSQSVLLAAMSHPEFAAQKEENFLLMRERALAVKQALENPAYATAFEPYPFNAGYFMCVRPVGVEAESVRVRLLERYGVGVIADGGDIRVAFSCLETGEISDLFDIIYRCVSELQKES